MQRLVSVLATALGVWLLALGSAYAQQGTGELRGRIVVRTSSTPTIPLHATSALTPGAYELSAQLSGYKKYQRAGVRVEVGKTVSIDVRLDIGGVEEEVTVAAESPLVDTTTKQLGGSVPTQELQDVPSLNRNFTSYLSLLPGINATISTDSFGADSIRVNGQATQNAATAARRPERRSKRSRNSSC